ncbi:uncharacterized protein F5891DRAFT_1050235 [Suillus fuscotomentosus]|uniref:G-patch domain-containing protein n=1 Tax=Suillus fuscotomentosus TaxID=1912939 RepID=A0AAD4DZZ7_9AGAM|nr:uncharacterized protein F5891DRAFT_1050235 [Suillus fuscotomentosus]KAG1897082.1 hypothetical protein F5891DRAFT_1050235 [Suillus fuscotomentosus]
MSTARLKRKLGDLGIDTSSRKANENFCLIGTPLPPLEKSKDTGEFVPLWKQEVRDEKGRRRLHGAFTGGFSAGYFNTVGSKEGWTPSTFISSRSDRATNKNRPSRPEDFMDEEDLTGMRDDQKLVDEHEQMDLLGGTQDEMSKRGLGADDKDAITLALEQSLLPAPKDSVGARILKKMGWRIGQGVGPRITWRQREIAFGRNPDVPSDDIDEEAKKHLYAPRDTPLIIVERKENFHGLGYDPGLGLHASLGVAPEASKQSNGPRLAGGFGLGALNDADDDDLDVYDHSQIRGRNHHAYDANDVHDEEHVLMSSRSQGARDLGKAAQPQRPSTGKVVFRDGKQPLNGFIISEKPVAEDLCFPIPDVPKDWTPNPKRVWEMEKANSKDKENASIPPPSQTQSHAQWKKGISANQRGAALGETPLPSAPRSIFEYISKKDQERIKNIAASRFAPPSTSDDPSPGPSLPTPPTITHTEPHVAQAALHGFQPFTTDPTKQARYTAYLHAHANPGSGTIPPAQKPGQSAEEFAKEINDYAKSAALFRPVSGAMAGRFTSAAVLDLGPKIIEGLHTPAAQPEEGADSMDVAEEKLKEEVKEEAPKVHAARLGMYGVMTREVCTWQPARLLCKRFGVKEPDLDVPDDTSVPSAQTAAPEFTGAAPADEFADASAGVTQAEGRGSGSSKRDVANIGMGEDDGQGDDVLTYERPGMDIFKAIFASDDEESDEEKDRIDDVDEVDEPPAVSAPAGPSNPAPDPDVKPPPSNGIVEDVDLATFKPTFIPRGSKPKETEKKERKNKKQKSSKGGILVSFDVDEDGGDSSLTAARQKHRDRDSERPRKKKRKDREGDGGEDMWVEKPLPDIVKALPVNLSLDEESQVSGQGSGPPRARKRAVDFM